MFSFHHITCCSMLVVGLASAVAISFGAPLVVGLAGLLACGYVIVVNL